MSSKAKLGLHAQFAQALAGNDGVVLGIEHILNTSTF
jgi:hypothetical protein